MKWRNRALASVLKLVYICLWDTEGFLRLLWALIWLRRSVSIYVDSYFTCSFTITQLFQLGGKVTAVTSQAYHSALALGKKTPPGHKTKEKLNTVSVLRKRMTQMWPDQLFSVLCFQQNWRQMYSNYQLIIKNNIGKSWYDLSHN